MAALAIASFCSCESESLDTLNKESEEFTEVPIMITKSDSEMIEAGNEFAFNLFEAICNDEKHSNQDIVISPLSLSFLLGALDNGAGGRTREQICEVLGYDGAELSEINSFSRKIMQGCGMVDNKVKVKIANAVVVNKRFILTGSFTDSLSTYYDALVESMDFEDPGTLDYINAWSKEMSGGLIPEILEENEFEDKAALYAMNSIYFKGGWASEFKSEDTTEEIFHSLEGDTKVQMMRRIGEYSYGYGDGFSTIRLPYGNGSYAMYIMLPDGVMSAEDMVKMIDRNSFDVAGMVSGTVDVRLPKFTIESKFDLVDIMKGLGMTDAFEAGVADFSNMIENSPIGELSLGNLLQKSKIIVNEEGSEASSVSIGEILVTSPTPSTPVLFQADRPFMYLIKEETTGAIYFIGMKI